MAGKLGKREKKQGANGRRYLIITARPMPFHAKNQEYGSTDTREVSRQRTL